MISQNIYYKDLILGNIIQPLDIVNVNKGGFNNYMKSVGRLGGQNKVPRLSNDRKIADTLNNFNVWKRMQPLFILSWQGVFIFEHRYKYNDPGIRRIISMTIVA